MAGKHQEAITQNKPDWLQDNYSSVLDVRRRSHPGPRQMTCELPLAERNFNCVISFGISSVNTRTLCREEVLSGRCVS